MPLTTGPGLTAVIAAAWLSAAIGAAADETASTRENLAGEAEVAGDGARGSVPVISGAHLDYVLECQGCHLASGEGVPGVVPRLREFVGYFLHLPEGRDFIARVPGIAQAPFDDADLARLINWMLDTFSQHQLPVDFTPYTAAEVGQLREDPVGTPRATRAKLIARLREVGVLTGPDDGFFVTGGSGGS